MNWLEGVARVPMTQGMSSVLGRIRACADTSPALVWLLPSRSSSERGRFGLFARPSSVQTLKNPQLDSKLFLPPSEGVRVIALTYEAGFPSVYLRSPAPPGGQPLGVVFDCKNGWVFDARKSQWGAFGEMEGLDSTRPMTKLQKIEFVPEDSDAAHARRIEDARTLISEGEIYQANLARTYFLKGGLSGIESARALAEVNPVAHGAYLRWDNFEVISNSMETFLRYTPQDRRLRSYPIKGTAGMSGSRAHHNLHQDPKEVAEHFMIVDLVRNDLGRVARSGSVEVEKLMELERFRGVYHGTSTVAATLSDTATLDRAVWASFPGGSITGAPKRRAMTVIRSLEAGPRGFFTGSIFLLTPDGYLNSSILIRTLVADRRGVTLSVGGGITIGSEPRNELEEIRHKASVFRDVLAG